jgi:ubiquinone/menaquinone biosynthesis C-methylase UbiE/DNA-binding transcriptional ArsR family regulator
MDTGSAIFDDLTTLSDATRGRMLLILDRQELTVSELCAVLQMPQSTVSRHLKTLADANWVSSRRDGTSRYYTLALDGRLRQGSGAQERDAHTRRLWALLREQIAATAAADQDARRLKSVLGRRQTKSEEFFASSAGQWDRLRRELFGTGSALAAIPALLDPRWTVGDLGCGTGETSAALAPFVARVIAVDRSGEMLQTARRRLRDLPAADVRRGELAALPIEDAELDAAVMILVLHHAPDPVAVLGEAARVLKSGGRLVVCDMLPHDHEEYKQQMGHVWLGFSEDQLRRLLGGAGFSDVRIVPLPVDATARGPALFVASGSRRES